MLYLITDGENKTIRDVLWGENITNEQHDNPNYLFSVYNDPLVAHMLNPAYEGYKNPNIWEAEGNISQSFGFRHECDKLTSIKKVDIANPTDDQRIAFAILCSLHLVSNSVYKNWAKEYLSGLDRTKEKAASVKKLLEEFKIGESSNHQDDYVSCGMASIMAVLVDPWTFAANAAHRAYYDSPEDSRIELDKLANISMKLTLEEMANVL